jgi:hypothetical protein
LPVGIGGEFGRTLGQAQTGIRYDQPHAVEPALLEVFEEGAPATPVFLGSFADAENLPVKSSKTPEPGRSLLTVLPARSRSLRSPAASLLFD